MGRAGKQRHPLPPHRKRIHLVKCGVGRDLRNVEITFHGWRTSIVVSLVTPETPKLDYLRFSQSEQKFGAHLILPRKYN